MTCPPKPLMEYDQVIGIQVLHLIRPFAPFILPPTAVVLKLLLLRVGHHFLQVSKSYCSSSTIFWFSGVFVRMLKAVVHESVPLMINPPLSIFVSCTTPHPDNTLEAQSHTDSQLHTDPAATSTYWPDPAVSSISSAFSLCRPSRSPGWFISWCDPSYWSGDKERRQGES